MVGLLVSKQPPWSIEMSTSTAPFSIRRTMSRVTSFGAAAPVTSTAPMTRSAWITRRSTASIVEYAVSIWLPNCTSSSRRRRRERSTTVTCAPSPTAICVALVPATPPPRMTTRAGATPGTPPSSTPKPPFAFCRAVAPTWIDMRPATSLIGVSSGSERSGAVTVS